MRPFFGSHFWNPFFTVLGPILGVIFVTFLSFFRSWAPLGRSSVFEGPPMQNASFLGARRPRNHQKGWPEGGPKMDPKKDTNKTLFGGRFLHLFWSLGPPLGHFVALLWPLGPRGPKREVQERPRAAHELPKGLEEFQERTGGSQESPGEFQNRPKSAPVFRKRGSSARINYY